MIFCFCVRSWYPLSICVFLRIVSASTWVTCCLMSIICFCMLSSWDCRGLVAATELLRALLRSESCLLMESRVAWEVSVVSEKAGVMKMNSPMINDKWLIINRERSFFVGIH